MSKSEACRLFHISRNTLHQWQQRLESEGHCRAVSLKGRPSARRKIKDLETFREFALAHSDKTQAEIAALWGEGINQQMVSRTLKELRLAAKNCGATAPEEGHGARNAMSCSSWP